MNVRDFKVLSFDCYGTLIDWECGILTALRPLSRRAGIVLDGETMLTQFAAIESELQAAVPDMRYWELLQAVHARMAKLWNVANDDVENERFAGSVGAWPAFADTVEALRALRNRYRMVILSNIDRLGFQATYHRLGVTFDAIYTAQDIGSYKPDPRNFQYLIDRMAEQGFVKSDILHVAQSQFHDHAPANAIGLASAWIDRRQGASGWGATAPPPPGVRYDFHFSSLAELAEASAA